MGSLREFRGISMNVSDHKKIIRLCKDRLRSGLANNNQKRYLLAAISFCMKNFATITELVPMLMRLLRLAIYHGDLIVGRFLLHHLFSLKVKSLGDNPVWQDLFQHGSVLHLAAIIDPNVLISVLDNMSDELLAKVITKHTSHRGGGLSELHLVVEYGNVAAVEKLLSRVSNVLNRNDFTSYCLLRAANTGKNCLQLAKSSLIEDTVLSFLKSLSRKERNEINNKVDDKLLLFVERDGVSDILQKQPKLDFKGMKDYILQLPKSNLNPKFYAPFIPEEQIMQIRRYLRYDYDIPSFML